MSVTIGLVANLFNEANALPGWLETHLPYFDDVRVFHAGPQGSLSDDGTLEILEKWEVPVEFGSIDEGFGVVRTRAIHSSPCEYVMLLDCDERFYPLHRTLTCEGQSTPQQEVDWILQSYDFRGVNLPNWENIARLGANLRVSAGEPDEQGKRLRGILTHWKEVASWPIDAIATVRRHWHDLGMKRPTQDWNEHKDWQLRLVRNDPKIYFDQSTKMHERLTGAAHMYHANDLFFDHFHFHFKRMEQRQRGHDLAIYDRIHAGEKPPTKKEHEDGQRG